MQRNQSLQAWDAADEYLLNHLHESFTPNDSDNILIFNETFGSLSLALHRFKPTVMIDSHVNELGISSNCRLNNLDPDSINIINSLSPHPQQYDYVLIRIPKSIDYLSYFLAKLRPYISSSTKIIASGMVKHIPKSTWNLFEKALGSTKTTLAKKKAKVISINVEKNITDTKYPSIYQQENTDFKIYNHANVFSKQSLDIGTRFLINKMPKLDNIHTIIDLGCGNGIVGLNLSLIYPKAKITFVDESYMAVDSARLTIENNTNSTQNHQFKVNNCLDGFPEGSTDLIVCNPPFHQNHTVGTHIAKQMFLQSYKVLKKNGYLIVIGNRHLAYHSELKKIFNNIKTIASNNKFNIMLLRHL